MTGGGFGGCVIALVPASCVAAVAQAVHDAMRDGGYGAPSVSATHAAISSTDTSRPVTANQSR